MLKDLDKHIARISESDLIKRLQALTEKLHQAWIGETRLKEKMLNRFDTVALAISELVKESDGLAEKNFVKFVTEQLSQLAITNIRVELIERQPTDCLLTMKYISFKRNGGYYLWLVKQSDQYVILCKRSLPIHQTNP